MTVTAKQIAQLEASLSAAQSCLKYLATELASLVPDPPPPSSGMTQPAGFTTLYFSDDFPGPALGAVWLPNMGDLKNGIWRNNGTLPAPYSGSSSGAFNAEYDNPKMIVANDGLLTISAMRDTSQPGYLWASGCIRTTATVVPAAHCYVQVRAKVPSGAGMWAGIWMLDTNGGSEIDILESGYGLGSTPTNREVAVNVHDTGDAQSIYTAPEDLSLDFHVYACEYLPGQLVRFYLDGVLIATYTQDVPTGAYELIVNLQVAQGSTGWHPIVTQATPSPETLSVSGVEVWTL